MDLALNAKDEAFREEVKAFLDEKMTDDIKEAGRLSSGVFASFELSQRWYKILSDKGWIAPGWPTEFGGPGWSPMQRYLFERETALAGTPRLFGMGIRMVGPVLMGHGRQDQKDYYLPRILAGEDIWCQGYSEPGSGSDLASLQTRAISDGDDYIVNGSKIWTSGAHHANAIFCLVRTSTEGKRQEGISFLLFPMDSPGITVEPIITLAGDHHLNQVFFDDVRVPKANRVGAENNGWTVAKYLLEFERGGSAYGPALRAQFEKIKTISKAERANGEILYEDPAFRRKLADAEVSLTAIDYSEQRVMSALSQGQNPGAASSMFKTRGSEMIQHMTELGVEAVAYYGAPVQREARAPGSNVEPVGPAHAVPVVPNYLNFRAASIYAGSNEIQRGIMAKLVLGL